MYSLLNIFKLVKIINTYMNGKTSGRFIKTNVPLSVHNIELTIEHPDLLIFTYLMQCTLMLLFFFSFFGLIVAFLSRQEQKLHIKCILQLTGCSFNQYVISLRSGHLQKERQR